jgi:hypothetical protein
MAISAIVAVTVLAGGAACASGYVTGMNFFQFTNYDNGNGDGSGSAFQSGGWDATTDGAIWISTGGATPVLNTQDLNFQLDYRSTPTSPWVTLTGAYLLSNGVAQGDVTVGSGGYPGYWMGIDGATAWGNDNSDSTSPYRITAKGPGIYYLPGTQPTGSPPLGKETQPGMQFNLYAWTGDYNSYAAAAGASAEVATSGAFQVGGTAYNDTETPPQTAFLDMPSIVLTVPGDANYDGKVDINDLTTVLTNFGRTAGMSWSTGDFTGDGSVDVNDLTIVLSNFGRSLTASAAGIGAVPEPSALVLIGVGTISLFGLLWQSRKQGG